MLVTRPAEHIMADQPTDGQIASARRKIAKFGLMLYEKGLTDVAGGNLSMRVGNKVCITPSYAGQKKQWQIDPEDVLVCDFNRNILIGNGQVSREANVHFSLLAEFAEYGHAVIHAHPRHVLVFAAAEKALPPMLEANRKFGVTPVIKFAPAHSPILAEHVAAAMRGREPLIKSHAAAVIAPWHGLFLMGRDMDAAFDAVERLDINAMLLLQGMAAFGPEFMEAQAARMEQIIGGFKE